MVMRRFCLRAYKTYRQAVTDAFNSKNLFYTNVSLSICISATGDIIEQRYEKYKGEINQLDFHRTAQMAFSGCIAGVICHHWYNFIDRVIIGRTVDMVIKKLILDQCICSPIIIMSFFATVAIFEDNPMENFTEEVREKFWTLYKAEWVVWPPAQIINFYFLPTKYRVVYDNTISLGYDVYTSQVKHSRSIKEVPDDEK